MLLHENELWDTNMGKLQLLKNSLHLCEVIIFAQLIIPFERSIPYIVSVPHYICQKWLHSPWCLCLGVSNPGNWDLQSVWVSAESTVSTTHASGSGLRASSLLPWTEPTFWVCPSKQSTVCAPMAAPQWEKHTQREWLTDSFQNCIKLDQ